MTSPALVSALADIDTVFNGFASPGESGCERCFGPEETAFLRTPYRRVPDELLNRFVFKDPLHFEDHTAVVRRLLPQTARAMADGGLDGIGWGHHALSRTDWRAWPAEQARAVEEFVHAWWQDTLRTPRPPYPAQDVFETCATILHTATPLLDRWATAPVADAHLLRCTQLWLDDLLTDASPFSWWHPNDGGTELMGLQAWLARYAPARLRAHGEPDLATQAELLALPYDKRWAHPYWTNASATN
ncbi:hypothetical protein ABZT04_38985 [Streptomyces sp. NPDC005492]|uniref:hypothetical protein n=1 Tax=Streptomyces sp. NPDC005492 TaxID=3156883 RepID=UPI0033B8280B